MTDEEYTRLSNLVSATVEQQAQFSEDLRGLGQQVRSLGEQTAANNEGIRALLAIAEIHERQIGDHESEMAEARARGKEIDERLNALINVVERQISDRNGKGQ